MFKPIIDGRPAFSDDFVPDIDDMDLTPLYGKKFTVGVSIGDDHKSDMLNAEIKNNLGLSEMMSHVRDLWLKHTFYAKVIIEDDKFVLDPITVAYIRANYDAICPVYGLELAEPNELLPVPLVAQVDDIPRAGSLNKMAINGEALVNEDNVCCGGSCHVCEE